MALAFYRTPLSSPCSRKRMRVAARCTPNKPSPIKTIEIVSGRLALGGVIGSSVIGNLTGKGLVEQYNDESGFIWCFVVGTTVCTLLSDTSNTIELQSTRIAMVAMAIIFALAAAGIQ